MRDMIIIEELEIWPEDFPERLTWHEAMAAVEAMDPAESFGGGWRLPTFQELKETIYLNRFNIPGIDVYDRGEYWSGTEINHHSSWYFRFMSRDSFGTSKDDRRLVRPVRDFDGKIALDYLLKDF